MDSSIRSFLIWRRWAAFCWVSRRFVWSGVASSTAAEAMQVNEERSRTLSAREGRRMEGGIWRWGRWCLGAGLVRRLRRRVARDAPAGFAEPGR